MLGCCWLCWLLWEVLMILLLMIVVVVTGVHVIGTMVSGRLVRRLHEDVIIAEVPAVRRRRRQRKIGTKRRLL